MYGVQSGSGRERRYYHDLGRATDYILRCKDCRTLVPHAKLAKYGCCECGNKRMGEITTLTPAEMETVRAMDFPYKEQFLAEFEARE